MPTPKAPPLTSPLAQQRLSLPDRPSQSWIADQISDRIGEVVGQQAVSYWEKGKVDLRNVHPRRLAAYAEVLRVSKRELAELAGYSFEDLFPDQYAASEQSAPTRTGPPIPPVVAPLDLPLEIPDELQQVIDRHGDDYPELHNEATLRALVAPRLFAGHSQGPQTAAQWLEYFLMNRRWLPQ